MAGHLKTYRLELITKSPVFIGSGKSLNKKSYAAIGDIVYIPNIEKMYSDFVKMNLAGKYEDFLLDHSTKETLGQWMRRNRVDIRKNRQWIDYTLSSGDLENNSPAEIATCVKDPYGHPYIPGSSLKGAMRTILLAYEFNRHPEYYIQDQFEMMKSSKLSVDRPKVFLKENINRLETKAFYTLGKFDDVKNAVNDQMSGMRISDSKPLSKKDLILCRKIDLSEKGTMHSINIIRECIKPGTKIEFEMVLDDNFPYSIQEIREAVRNFAQRYYNSHYRYFMKKCSELDKIMANTIWLGGGCGFVSKTIIYPLLYKKDDPNPAQTRADSVRTVADILQKNVKPKVAKQHNHLNDPRRDVSPHILKVTECYGKLYEFGQCAVSICEENR